MGIDTDRKSQDCDVEEQEGAAMRRIIRACMEDISSAEVFQFSLRCAVCGSLWKSQPVWFSIDLCMDCAAFLQERGEPVAAVSAKPVETDHQRECI